MMPVGMLKGLHRKLFGGFPSKTKIMFVKFKLFSTTLFKIKFHCINAEI